MRFGDFMLLATPALTLISVVLVFLCYVNVKQGPILNVQPVISSIDTINLPIIEFGIFSSCLKLNSSEVSICAPLHDRRYRIDVITENAAKGLLRPPPQSIQGLIGFSVGLTTISLLFWVWLILSRAFGIFHDPRLKLTKDDKFGRKIFHVIIKWMPFVAFLFGFLPFLSLYMLMEKVCHDFNGYNDIRGRRPDDLYAKVGDGFIMAWIGYSILFHTVTVLWVYCFSEDPVAGEGGGGRIA